jgi:hypothetical protein
MQGPSRIALTEAAEGAAMGLEGLARRIRTLPDD